MKFEALPSALDRSVNFIHRTVDGGALEARFVQREDPYFIAYLSSHTGCDRACRFCHLTQTGQTMMRPASLIDYTEQARAVLAHYATRGGKARRVNFNFMARGEPFLNDTVLRDWNRLRTSLAVAAEPHGLEPRFNLSTIFPKGLTRTPLINVLGRHPMGTSVYYSLYSLEDAFRRRWLPKAADPFVAMTRLREWQREAGGEVVLHWAFIEGQNDDDRTVENICEAVRTVGLDARFNLVRYNPYSPLQGREPNEDVIQRQFAKLQEVCGQPGSRIVPRVGFDVKASCGMFVQTATPRGRRETSKQAADAIRPVRARLSEAVFDLIRESPRTCWEVEQLSSLSHQTASARVNDLLKAGRIIDSGERRKTGAGRKAIVWREVQPEDNASVVLIAPTGKAAKALRERFPPIPDGKVLIEAAELNALRRSVSMLDNMTIMPTEMTPAMEQIWREAFATHCRRRKNCGPKKAERILSESAEEVAYRTLVSHVRALNGMAA